MATGTARTSLERLCSLFAAKVPVKKRKPYFIQAGIFENLDCFRDDFDYDKSMKVIATNFVAAVITTSKTSASFNDDSCDNAS